jgi:hypothetical protein
VRAGREIQVFLYTEELEAVEPAALAEQILELGCDSVSIALTYHRARRVFPRQGRISNSPGGAVSFTPEPSRYGELVPRPTASADLRRSLESFRDACATAGLGFRAWLVALHSEPLARAHPRASAQMLSGDRTDFSLCPSAAAAVEYVSSLVADVGAQFEPGAVDLEAALYPAWDPSYTLTLALDPLSESAVLFAGQCFCSACRELCGEAADELERRARRAAGPPFGPLGEDDAAVVDELAQVRARGVARLLEAAAQSARGAGATLCVTASGPEPHLRIRGLAPSSAAAADRVLLGHGILTDGALEERFRAVRPLAGDRDVTVSMNWTPDRTPESLAADAELAAREGATGLALYNLTLVPEHGLEAFRRAASAFRAANPA